jgi:hypothetical protein
LRPQIKLYFSEKGQKVTTDPINSIASSLASNALSAMSEWASPDSGLPPRSGRKPKAARPEAPNREAAKRTVPPARPPRPAARQRRGMPSPQTVTLQGIAEGKTLGGYSLSYAMGQLIVDSPRLGGIYGVESLPIGEWFALVDGRGFPLPVAIQRTRMDAYSVRVDRAPLQGLRTLPSYPGWVPSGTGAPPNPRTPQQQRQNDQMAVRTLQNGLNDQYQAEMNTARHLRA